MILDIVEVLLYFVCILFSVAFLTVAERKTLGYMQRRVGPNIVGQHTYQRLNQSKRTYHTSSILYNNNDILKETIEQLYKDRIVPVKNFDSNIITTCSNLLSSTERSLFLKE
jgi:hypothetical protein